MNQIEFNENAIRALSHCIKGVRRIELVRKMIKIHQPWIDDPTGFVLYCNEIDTPDRHTNEFVMQRINKKLGYQPGNVRLVPGGWRESLRLEPACC